MKRTALILLDLQEDFLARPGLHPSRSQLTRQAEVLLRGCRSRGIPALHVNTVVRPDGSDRMPHWKRADRWACVAGTPGAEPPAELRPLASEPTFRKRFYSAFDAPGLDACLREGGVQRLLLAGVYLHACVRTTALDAYARDYEVWIVEDSVGSTEPVHAAISRDYLRERGIHFVDTEEAIAGLYPDDGGTAWGGSDPPRADRDAVAAAGARAGRAQGLWRQRPVDERLALLASWAARLASAEEELTELVISEIGKPRSGARSEVRRAVAHVQCAVRLASEPSEMCLDPAAGVRVRHRPVGTIGIVTPWNNPLAIPVGKIAPALAFGNAVVWKPAPQASRTAERVATTLRDAGIPPGLVAVVLGEGDTARYLMAEASVQAISVTGSIATGRVAAALCARHGKPLQAELGGNNAVIVLSDCELEEEARHLALAAFAFAGQRCTAPRRIIVEEPVLQPFTKALVEAVERLQVGDPHRDDVQVGPLVSAAHRRRVAAAVEGAIAEGGRILCGGAAPPELEPAPYFLPTLITDLGPEATLVQEETFGPVAVLLSARDLDEAIRLANAVPHGLVAGLRSRSETARRRFAEAIEAGILHFAPGALAVHPEAPFGGWKASGLGPPEHGIWDRQFYTRPQAVYAAGDGEEPRR